MSDSFAQIPEFPSKETSKKKVKYTKIIPGYPIRIRILDTGATSVIKHFLPKQRISIVCLGEECPVCINNKKLAIASPDVKYNEIPGVIPRQYRFLVNILNRTFVKTSPSGAIYYAGSDGKFPPVSETGEDLTSIDAKQLNTVEVLEKGTTLFTQLNAIYDSYRNEDGERIGLTNFDIILTATGKGKNMTITALPALQHNDKIVISEEEMYKLDTISIRLSADEAWKLLEGTSFQDVIEGRKAIKVSQTAVENKLAKEVEDELDQFFEEDD